MTKELTPVAGEGIFPKLATGELMWEEGILEQVISTGVPFYHDGETHLLEAPLACVPLKIKDEVVGAIAIFKLLVQKDGFAPMDTEILNLLAGQAATAIVCSRIYADADRKLKTIEGFIELLRRREPLSEATLSPQEE
jgi:GAF domain-containing protein